MASGVGTNILITGANRGIGFGIVEELAKSYNPTRIFAGVRDPTKAKGLEELKQHYPAIHIVKLDVQDDGTIESAKGEVEKLLGGDHLNMVINNAGIAENAMDPNSGGRFTAPQREYYARHFDVNVNGLVMVNAAFLPLLKSAAAAGERALVINISSSMASLAMSTVVKADKGGNVAYSLTKIALNHYSRLVSQYLKDSGVIVVALAPGWVKTDMGNQGLGAGDLKLDPRYGQAGQLTIEESVVPLCKTIAGLTLEDTGKYMNRLGEVLPD